MKEKIIALEKELELNKICLLKAMDDEKNWRFVRELNLIRMHLKNKLINEYRQLLI